MTQTVTNDATAVYTAVSGTNGAGGTAGAKRLTDKTIRTSDKKDLTDLKDCLNEALRLRSRVKETDGSGKVSEQDMYAALGMRELSKLDSVLGSKLKAELPQMLERMGTSKGEQTMLKAVDRIMRAMVRSGEISHDEYRSVRDTAFGKSQFNADRTELSDYGSKPSGSGSNTLSVGEALQKAETGQAASAGEIGAWRARGAEISRQKYLEKKANGTLGKNKAAKAVSAAAAGGPAAAAAAIAETPKGFLWKPQSDSDGKLAILLPSDMLYSATGVRVLSPGGKSVLADGRFVGVFGATGRRIYRFTKEGDSFPPGCRVEIQLATGETKAVTVPNPWQRLERK